MKPRPFGHGSLAPAHGYCESPPRCWPGCSGSQVNSVTRRLEPMDRVRELGDASVPFRYDVHALFFSEDAIALPQIIHGLRDTGFGFRRADQA